MVYPEEVNVFFVINRSYKYDLYIYIHGIYTVFWLDKFEVRVWHLFLEVLLLYGLVKTISVSKWLLF